MHHFPKAVPVPRGCGERNGGGVYVESGLSPFGTSLETFLVDPPLPPPAGLGKEALANKPQLWVRTARSIPNDPGSEYIVMHPGTDIPIVDLVIWIGAQYYPYVSDYIEEMRRYGVSRKLNPLLPLSQLSRESRMILIHPYALNTLWQTQLPPRCCGKSIARHQQTGGEENKVQAGIQAQQLTGPCLWKCYDLIPRAAALNHSKVALDATKTCLREIGSTFYSYQPTGEDASGLSPGIFAVLPITGFALIQREDKTVHEKARSKLIAAQEQFGKRALPFYETDR